MRPHAPLALLLVAPLLACFADAGTSTATNPGTFTSASASSSSGTTDEPSPTTGTPGDTTTTPPLTDTSTTDEPTGTTTADPTLATSTGPVGNCEVAPQCKPGDIQDGELCDSCGVLRSTCQADCVFSPPTCELAPETCEYWLLPPDSKQWQRVAVDPNAAFAPKQTVLAAIALEPQHEIYALTAATYHVFSTKTNAWTAAGARDTLFPQAAGQPLFHATGLANEPPDVIVTLVAGAQAFSYTFVAAKNSFDYVGTTPCCGEDWMGPNAPPTPFADVRDGWSRKGNSDGWITGDPQVLCKLDDPSPVYAYNISIGNGLVYPQDIGYCFDFYAPVPYEQFAPFSYPGTPANNLIGGSAYADGLYIFRGE
jgi:hypothetical protein